MLARAIRKFLAAHGLAPRRVLLAVSGGFDSTAMLLAFAELRESMDVVAGHVNHHLRGEESDGDEAFVRDLCERLGVPVRVADGTLDETAVRDRGVEAAAREVRFARLQEIRREVEADLIATAHQRDDQAETVLMRLMAGGGPAALRGIHPVRDDGVIRPLLDVPRREIVAFLEAQGIHPRTDRSNSDPRFLRNRVRKLLGDAPPEASGNLAQAAALARAQWRVLDRAIDAAEDAVVSEDATHFRSLPDDPWLRQALLHRHIVRLDPARARDVGAKKLERLQRETAPRVTVTKSLELLRDGVGLTLRRIPQPAVIEPFEEALTLGHPAHDIEVTKSHEPPGANRQPIQLPTGGAPEFKVRNRRAGDRFQPLGYKAPTKLKDFLIGRKVPRQERDGIPLVVWNGEIVWVAGVAVSERFKTEEGEGDVYTLRWRGVESP